MTALRTDVVEDLLSESNVRIWVSNSVVEAMTSALRVVLRTVDARNMGTIGSPSESEPDQPNSVERRKNRADKKKAKKKKANHKGRSASSPSEECDNSWTREKSSDESDDSSVLEVPPSSKVAKDLSR